VHDAGDPTGGGPGEAVANTLPSAKPEPAQEFARGSTLGRYVILDWLGGGGMGVVYAAYDPELDRKIAIKLLHPDGRDVEGRTRLMREAQAMARVAHPNVIPVYDVGTFRHEVFLAMEFVEGTTLARWLKEEPRSTAEVLAMFRQAGSGLAAAHAGGLVHRDFKPDNVIVGKDGRARVLDFGLACALRELEPVSIDELPEVTPSHVLNESLTATNHVVGTPLYMSPEQWRRGTADERSDQFSFCVALYEALYGERPFKATSPLNIRHEVLHNRIREPPAGSKVPAWLRAVLLRGLRVDRQGRYPSMDALLEALRRDPSARRRRFIAAAAATTIAAGALIAGVRGVALKRSLLCTGSEAQLQGVWDGPRRDAVQAAFLATGVPYAKDAFAGVARALDAFGHGWATMRREACEATRLRGEQSEELLDLRMQCLDQRREELHALVDVFTHADGAVVAKAVQAASGIEGLASCANAKALRAPVRPPRDPEVREKVRAVRAALARAVALQSAGNYAGAKVIATAVLADAKRLGYRPLEAEASYRLANLQMAEGKDKEAQAGLMQAAAIATAAHDDRIAALSWVSLIRAGTHLARYADAEQWSRLAESSVERAGAGEAEQAELLVDQGILLEEQGKYDDALDHYRRALAIRERTLGPEHPSVATVLVTIGVALAYQGKRDEGLANYRRALAIDEKVLGKEHPSLVDILLDIGLVLVHEDQNEEALACYRRALAIGEKSLGEENADVAAVRDELGSVLVTLGYHEEALRQSKRALAIQEKIHGPAHPDVAQALATLGYVLGEQGKPEEALPMERRALAIMEGALGPQHADVATMALSLGDTLLALRRYDEAIAAFERAAGTWEKIFGPGYGRIAEALTGEGRALLGLHATERAVASLERALAVCERQRDTAPSTLAETRFALARALSETGRERARAITLAKQARETWATSRASSRSKERAAIDEWLSKHP
jgi:tetratricopeptide (TPR) repeat protein/tRNA A-37 threonylcarbamoyl transferase component Bud32